MSMPERKIKERGRQLRVRVDLEKGRVGIFIRFLRGTYRLKIQDLCAFFKLGGGFPLYVGPILDK